MVEVCCHSVVQSFPSAITLGQRSLGLRIPRLSNLKIDGINVPSLEKGVRQIKLDTIPAELVESVEINKTLQANMDGDGIGGSVNLVTKTAGERPTFSAYGMGGFTPILGTRGVDEFGATAGKRFGPDKKLGLLFGGDYDYNGRGINDIEPSPTTSSLTPHYDSMDIRDYKYYRTRYGFTGSADYKVNDNSTIFIRGLYSDFKDFGDKWTYTLNDGDVPKASVSLRRPDFAIGSISAGGHHVFSSSWLSWNLSVARSRQLASAGDGGASFSWNGGAVDCTNITATDMYRPAWSPSCFASGSGNTTDINNYKFKNLTFPGNGLSAQLNLQGEASYAKNYHVGSHLGTFEFGGKVRNAHKFDDSYQDRYQLKSGSFPSLNQFLGTFTDPNYYDNSYPMGTQNVNYSLLRSYVTANAGMFKMADGYGPGVNANNFDYVERVSAGYLMNTLDLTSRLRLIAGVRFEGTQLDASIFDPATTALSIKGNGSYLNVLPSAALRIKITDNSGVRLVFSQAVSRPDPQDIAQAQSPFDNTNSPYTVSIGNPKLKAERANNYDLLYEHYLKPMGMIQAGVFYKQLSDPIIATTVVEPCSSFSFSASCANPTDNVLVSQPGNAGQAHLAGFEVAYVQHLGFLPGPLSGLGISANYSYTASEASGLPGRSDHPALLRQAPHTWNISPTYDRGRFSLRVGMTYNSANIHAYQYQNLNSDGTPMSSSDLTPGGTKGPGGDEYFYSHFQVDAEGSFRIAKGFTAVVSGLNLNNEVFGFYWGSPQYVVQREYYKPTYSFGLRWTPSFER